MAFHTEVRGLDQVITRFQGALDTVQNLQPVFEVAALEFGRIETERFNGNNDWPEDTERTQRFKESLNEAGPTLVRSQALRDQLTRPDILEESATELRMGTTLPYAAIQQTGFTQKWAVGQSLSRGWYLRKRKEPTRNPARKPVDLSSSDKFRISYQATLELKRRLGF